MLPMYGLAFFLLLTNVPGVEDIFAQGTCNWICTDIDDIDEESKNILASGSLVKFSVLYEEQVNGECANHKEAKNSSARASLWLKMAAGGKPRKIIQGRLQLFTQAILEGIFLGTYKEINVSCVFKLTSSGNYSSKRLTFHTLQSVLYFVEAVANYTQPSTAFLTLLRTEKNTRLSIGATNTSGSFSSTKSTKDNELIVTDGWLAVALIIWIVVFLYFPAIFILFRPSEIKLKVPRKTRDVQKEDQGAVENTYIEQRTARGPIKFETGYADYIDIKPYTREGHLPSAGHDEMIPSQRSSNSAGSYEGSNIDENARGRSLSSTMQHGGGEFPGFSVVETKSPSDGHCEITLQRPYRKKVGDRVNRLKKRFEPDVNGKNLARVDLLPNLGTTNEHHSNSGRRASTCCVPLRSERPQTGSSTINDKPCSSDTNQCLKELSSNENIGDQDSSQNRNNDSEQASSSQSKRNIEEPSGPDDTRIDIDQKEDEEETEYALAIIVGKTYPVGFGSWIGKRLFSTTHDRNKAWNIVKLVFLFSALPLLFFLGLGDLFLVLLPKLHSRLSDHFPFAFLTPSLGYGFINYHPAVQVLIVLSAPAYLTRLCFLCFLSRSTVEASWRSCCFHRMHAICNLLQKFTSRFPSIPKPCEKCCNPAPSECKKYLDLPENILHNLEKLPDIFIKYWDSFYEFWLDVCRETKSFEGGESPRKKTKKEKFARIVIGIFFSLAIIVSIIVDILCTSPLVCLCHWRLWMLTERYKNKFKWSGFILPVLDFLLMFLSLVWVTIFSLLYTIPLGVAIVGFIKVLGNHTNEVLPQVTIAVLAVYYFWTCYRSFRTPYRYVAKFLASRYQKKYDEQDNTPVVNALIHYKQGDLSIIPKELFDDGCKEFKLSFKNNVTWLFVELVCTLLAFSFIFPILVSDDVSDPSSTTPIATFLAVAYVLISKAISGEEFQISKVQADKVVNDYIARKQRDSS